MNSISVGPSTVLLTHRFFHPRPPTRGSKNVTFNYMDGIGTWYTSHDKEICLHGKRQTTSKSINQIRPVLMLWWNVRGRGVKKQCFFPQDKLYTISTDEKRGERVGFFTWERIRGIQFFLRDICQTESSSMIKQSLLQTYI